MLPHPRATVALPRNEPASIVSCGRRGGRLAIAMVLCATLVGGCADATGRRDAPAAAAATDANGDAATDAARVIVRFRSPTTDPADPAFRARWAAEAGVPWIDPIRPMSGHAYVLRVGCLPGAAPAVDRCAGAVDRLRRSDAVIDVEIDARATHQR